MLGIEIRRKDLTLTRAELAEKLGVAPNTIFRWEKGERNPDLGNLKKLSKLLGVSIDFLVSSNPTQQIREKTA